jgi:iron(II)-dependent oxidoreductase
MTGNWRRRRAELAGMDIKERIEAELGAARHRSLALLEPVPDEDLVKPHSTLMSPLVWDLAHVGNYEEQWLLGAVGGVRASRHLDDVYDAFRHPRPERPRLPMLNPPEARAYVAEVRGRVLQTLGAARLEPEVPLLTGGFVYGMVAQHEHQHDETMLATLQLRAAAYPLPPVPGDPPSGGAMAPEVLVPAGAFVMGTDAEPWAYDNERPAHVVDLPPFWIDTTPVTNRSFAEFVEAGGYREPRWWQPRGWAWRQEAGLEHPRFWVPAGGGSWARRRFGVLEPLAPDEPVQHVCWFEADAYARWAGKRLPTEAEWEKAASWGPDGRKRRYPWGDDPPTSAHANLAPGRFVPAPAGSFPRGRSAYGCAQMIGDVWEWTASDFSAYPGFRSFPYAEYSAVFFGGDYKVLRGGSWATHPTAIRTTFRNWDHPIRSQIFAGFRCARDAD